ncbi:MULTISPECIES: kynureninase [unclassified Psychrobacillus]|uniref:kynureninase n=1 Tax=unclassified Psychrobacillus TaxID=2636677 RepID=UPI00146F2B7F|nr:MULTISPECIES: kynureninase [unclassified Psychrobacillus]MCM3359092.1 kynureninase [Psychrobacillus sp. MER TA 171]NME06805.1 kynureninase [Psychrobacillus sp. BL-248-WT-3]
MECTIEFARKLDQEDDINHYRQEFYIPANTIYMDGNSLGLLSRRAELAVLNLLDSWKNFGIDGWTKGEHPWFHLSEKLGEMCAPLIGAMPEEVIITGSTTTNLHQLIATFYKPQGKKTKIVVDELNFPSDLYAVSSQLSLHGKSPEEDIVMVKGKDGLLLEEDIIEAMTEEVAMIVLPSVLYRSGQILNIKKLTDEAHKRDILIGFDLCHSIGAIPHSLDEWGVDFAFWCTYKHLNGGPGSVGGLYTNQKHLGKSPGLAGWFGSRKEKQFDLEIFMTPAGQAGSFQIGTPHILSAAPLLGSLEIFGEVGIHKIRSKSEQLTEFMRILIENELSNFEFTIITPSEREQRGGHLFLMHKEAARICKALKSRNIIPDYRPPNGIRLAPVALYNTFEEVWKTVNILKEIMEKKEYSQYDNEREVIA